MSGQPFRVREAVPTDHAEWVRLRCLLWPHGSTDHGPELTEYFASRDPRMVTLVAATELGLCGFLELGFRNYANECETSPVAYIEGWYVESELRRRGVGRALVHAAEAWAVRAGYREIGSDTELSNDGSIAAHQALGYERTPPIVCFRRSLNETLK